MSPPKIAAACVLVVLASSACPLVAQKAPAAPATSTRPAPTDPRTALAEMRDTLAAAQGWTCGCAFTQKMGGIVIVGAESTLTLRHDPEGKVTGLRVKGKFLPGGTRFDAASTDGATLRALNLDDKVYEDTPWGMREALAAGPPGPGSNDVNSFMFLVPLPFYQPSDFTPAEADTVKLAGTVQADGVLCDVVDIVSKFGIDKAEMAEAPDAQKTRYAIGRDDHLPRLITRSWGGAGSFPHRLTNWKLNPPMTDATFKLDVAGAKAGIFKIKKGDERGGNPFAEGSSPFADLKIGDTPSDFALKDTAGKEHKLSAYKGKPVLVHFSNLDDSAGDALLTKMKAKHGGSLVVLDLIVGPDDGIEPIKKAKKAATFPRLAGGQSVADAWGINMFSMAILVGPDGKVAARLVTGVVGGAIEGAVDAVVRKMGDYLKNPAKGW